jgi:uncharacterized protein (DUF3084 family)
METYQVPMPNEGAHDKVLTRADFEKERDTLRVQIEALQVRYDDVTSEEHSIPELRKQLWDAFDEKQKCYAAVSRYQIANKNLIEERDALQAQVEALSAALRNLQSADWVEVMRDGQLVTWGDAGTLGYRVKEAIDAAIKGSEAC